MIKDSKICTYVAVDKCDIPIRKISIFRAASSELSWSDEERFSRLSECKPSCRRNEYLARPVGKREKLWDYTWYYMDNYVQIWLYYGTSRVTVKEQYYTYGFDSFIADIGGYLGLLLGNSILGFYDTLIDLVKVAYDKKWAGKCIFCK